jgi:hypothetical protein
MAIGRPGGKREARCLTKPVTRVQGVAH